LDQKEFVNKSTLFAKLLMDYQVLARAAILDLVFLLEYAPKVHKLSLMPTAKHGKELFASNAHSEHFLETMEFVM